MFRRSLLPLLLVLAAAVAIPVAAVADEGHGSGLRKIDHIVVIYEENHSFDNLYGRWEGVDGLSQADAAHTRQISAQTGNPFTCLLQDDVNLAAPDPLSATCTDASVTPSFASHFANAPFRIDDFIQPGDLTCPQPFHEFDRPNGWKKGEGAAGGCTRDLVHRFYQEQYQLNGGHQNRYVTGSDAVGLSMGVYDTRALPIYDYLHGRHHPAYAILDNFFQAAFGGSFLNHQWLIAARTPVFPNAPNDGTAADQHSVVDANGMPTNYPLYVSPLGTNAKDRALTASCNPAPTRPPTPPGVVCGDYAVNTTQPFDRPFSSFGLRLPAQTYDTIGERLNSKGIDWAWYAGGWSNAAGLRNQPGWTNGNGADGTPCADPYALAGATLPYCADRLFQFHHQPFAYFQNYGPGTPGRAAHLRDEAEFMQLAQDSDKKCQLKPVSFVKPIGEENEHPGYTGEAGGSDHLVQLLQLIENSRCARDTMVVVTYDEFGGQWDHVTPPGQGGTPGPHDQWGPGTRIPALVVSPFLRGEHRFAVDDTQYDTTSILATIEKRYGLAPLGTRDAAVNDLSHVFGAGEDEGGD